MAALLVLAAGALGWWIGSSGDNGTADAPEIVDRVVQAYVDGDPEAVAAAYADDAIFEEKELEELVLNRDETFSGRSAIRGHTEMGFQYADIDEMTVDAVMELDNLIVFEWTALGASAPSPGAAERFPFETTGVMVFEMAEDGLIGRSFLYYDSDEYFNVGTS